VKAKLVWFLTLMACASQPLSKEDFFTFRKKFEALKINQAVADAVKSLGSPTSKKTNPND
jgi:hypothetical protein